MRRIALTGNRGSGKSSLARGIEAYGFYCISYTDLIKKEVARALKYLKYFKSVEEGYQKIERDKERYRPLLIAWADNLGWSNGEQLNNILRTLTKTESIILDNVRIPAQADIVQQFGFCIVRLQGGIYVDIPHERLMDNYPVAAEIPWIAPLEDRITYSIDLFNAISNSQS